MITARTVWPRADGASFKFLPAERAYEKALKVITNIIVKDTIMSLLTFFLDVKG